MMAPRPPASGAGDRTREAFNLVPLSGKQRRVLRARAHHLDPVVSIGARGLTDAVIAELEVALDSHELVKLRIAADDRKQRESIIESLCRRTNAEFVQRIGHTAVVYRERPEEQTR